MRSVLLLLFFLPLLSIAQKKKITLEDIYKNRTFAPEFVPGFITPTDDERLFNPQDIMDAAGKKINPDDYIVSGSKKSIVFFADRESIYRYSSKATAYIYDVATKKITPVNGGKVMNPTFSPDGSKLAYVMDNNLYITDLASGAVTPVTTDGKWNEIINGNPDWVYEEEFGIVRAYEWSPKGNYLAYYKFDESAVKEFAFTVFDDQYNKQYNYKYPKAGDSNSKVTIHIYDVAGKKAVPAQYEAGDIYIPRIKWTQQDNQLVVYWMNRHQDQLKLLLTDAATGAASTMYEEKNKYYIDINDNWWFLKDGKHFLFTSEMGGFNSLYLYSLDGKRKLQLAKQPHDIDEVLGVDEASKLVYYSAAYPAPMDRNLFVTDFDGKNTRMLTSGAGWHRVELKNDYTQFMDFHSTINDPQVVTLYDLKKNKNVVTATRNRVLNESSKVKSTLSKFDIAKTEFIRVPNSKGDTLNGWMLRPSDFDASKKYPVIFMNYGGPGSQRVVNRYGTVNMWQQMLAQQGFIVVCIDNTGTGFRGEEFKKKTYLQLGKLEIEDQIDAAKYLGKLPYIDAARIGHWGWSYGGFMSSLAISKGADVFKAAIAVAPVTSWRFYDNIYTERYMRTPQENAKGYDENAPLNFANRIKGKFLLIHGTADDNVHFQNSTEYVKALVKANIDFDSFYYPNKNHGINGNADNTSFHLYSKMTKWLLQNLKENNAPLSGGNGNGKTF